jgi:hypothetical protein
LPTFDFHEFLEQFKNAPTISRYTKAFISSFFGKSRSTLDQQIKSVQDFLSVSLSCLHCFSFFSLTCIKKYCYVDMRECDVWKDMSEDEFENAKEGMEKLLMNRLYPM